MKTRRTILVTLVAGAFLLIAGRFAWRAYERAQLPKYEGGTADEWVDHFAAAFDSGLIVLDELHEKELLVVFSHFEPAGLHRFAQEFCAPMEPGAYSRLVDRWNSLVPAEWNLMTPAQRHAARWAVLRLLYDEYPPAWHDLEPFLLQSLRSGMESDVAFARYVMGYVGDGATNAGKLLADGLINGMKMRWTGTLQSLQQLGENAAPALPALLSSNEVTRWNQRHFDIFGNMGSQATPAVPYLEKYLSTQSNTEALRDAAAVALVRIDPEYQIARVHLEERLVHAETNAAGQEIINATAAKGPRNRTIAELAELQFHHARNGTASLWVLMHHDPETAVLLARSQLAQKRDEMEMIRLLLRHDPNDPEALAAVRRRLTRPDFTNDPYRRFWLELLQHSYSDTAGALKILGLAEDLNDAEVQETVREIRRHIELNDQLRLLARSDAGE